MKHSLTVRMMPLGDLLNRVHEGSLALPDFQRDFEWTSADVEQMLVTAFNAWPAGSLLLLEGDGSFFDLRAFNRGPETLSSVVRYVVLDGQQRITALYHAIYDKGDRTYFVDGRLLLSTGELEDSIQAISRQKWKAGFSDPLQQAEKLIIPCSALKTPTHFFEWRDSVVAFAALSDDSGIRSSLTQIYKTFLAPIHDYQFPAVVLEDTTSHAAVAKIFERVNRLGLRLNTFDLMVARTYDQKWNLRESWKTFGIEEFGAYEFFERDGMAALQVIALAEVNDVRQSAVLGLSAGQVRAGWSAATTGLRKASAYFQTRLLARDRSELPYSGLSVLVAAILDELDVDRSWNLDAFVWSRSFGRAYDVASNTRLVSDYKRFRRSSGRSESLYATDLSEIDLVLAGKQGAKALSSALTLLIRSEFARYDSLDVTENFASVGMFPSNWGEDAPGEPSPSSRVLNNVILPRSMATSVQRTGFSRVLEEMFGQEEVLKANFLPVGPELRDAMARREWGWILNCRAKAIVQNLKERGVIIRPDGWVADAVEDDYGSW